MSEEIFVNALNLTPYFVRQDGAHYCFRGVPEDVQKSFYAIFSRKDGLNIRPYNLYISGKRQSCNFIKVLPKHNSSKEITFGLGCIFNFINSDDDYAQYLLWHDKDISV